MNEGLHDKDQWLLAYIDGELSAEEQKMVEEKINTEADWKEAAEKLFVTVKGIQYFGISQEVAAVHQQFLQKGTLPAVQKTKVISFPNMGRLFIGVAACALFIFLGVTAYQFYNLSPDKVFTENFVAYQPGVSRGVEKQETSIKTAYENGRYSDVVDLSKRSPTPQHEDRFYVGLSYLQQNDAASAITWLQPLAEAINPLQQDAQFYLSLALIKNKDYSKALTWVQKIKDDEHHLYHDQYAKNIVSQLKMLRWRQ